ncbi:DUF881 domain-containing protein [Alicyclobacillaceae bacterium I2511]|nr:DUF881 domain-containing protein [Alicyclobacillaceae bacterium I2511]
MTSTKTKLMGSLTVVAMVLGFMVSLQYKQQLSSHLSGTALSSVDQQEQTKLENQFSALKQANGNAQADLAKITTELSDYEQRTAGNNASLQHLQQALQDERILAGMTPVEGPGVTVTLMDGIATGPNVEKYLTHDWDVRSVINELFTAGAEAISINGYRVVATSGIYCTGPVVKINDHRIGAPFTIAAIGDPQTLNSALQTQGGILDALRSRGISVSQPQIQQVVHMPAYIGPLMAASITGS